jgi:hypothetical protein
MVISRGVQDESERLYNHIERRGHKITVLPKWLAQ